MCSVFFDVDKSFRSKFGWKKGKFSVKFEIDDLRFVIHPGSQHRRRGCLGILKQSRNYKKELERQTSEPISGKGRSKETCS